MLGTIAKILTTILSTLFVLKTNTEKKVLRKVINFIINFQQLCLLLFSDNKHYYNTNNLLPFNSPSNSNSHSVSEEDTEKQALQQNYSELSYDIQNQNSGFYLDNYKNYNTPEPLYIQQSSEQLANNKNYNQKKKNLYKNHPNNIQLDNVQSNTQKSTSQNYYLQNIKQQSNTIPSKTTELPNLQQQQSNYQKFLQSSNLKLEGYNSWNFCLMNDPEIRKMYINPEFIQNQSKLLRNCQTLKCTCIRQKRLNKRRVNFQPTILSVVFEDIGY